VQLSCPTCLTKYHYLYVEEAEPYACLEGLSLGNHTHPQSVTLVSDPLLVINALNNQIYTKQAEV
jgi:ribonuclease HI